tara:strand:+ start:279 stop:446 length:168 start_codon:yes stop_codon:yes gene_type:complete
MRDVDNRDMHKMLWMEPPKAPFGGSKFEHKIKADVLKAYLKSEKKEANKVPQKPI